MNKRRKGLYCSGSIRYNTLMNEQKKSGQPTKMTEEFFEIAERILKEGNNVLALTDEELLLLINEELPEGKGIANRTFQLWKGKPENYPQGERFLRLIKKALLTQKRNVLGKLEKDSAHWQRYAWIMERKFEAWNLKKISSTELKGEVKGIGAFFDSITKD